jgi:hypothetical protein
MPPRRRSPLPACTYCERSGLGDPPLCRRHYEAVHYGGDNVPNLAFDEFDELLQHPYAQSFLAGLGYRLGEVFGSWVDRGRYGPPAAPIPRASGPDSGFAAQWPPASASARNGRARRRPEPEPEIEPPPPPSAPEPREVLGFAANQRLTVADVEKRRRELAAIFHPDKPLGSNETMRKVNAAADALISQLGG